MIEAVLMGEYSSLLSDRHLSLENALDRMMSVQGSVCTKMAFVTLADDSRLITLIREKGGFRLAVLIYDRRYEQDATKPVYRETDIRWFEEEDLDSCRWCVVQSRGFTRYRAVDP